MNALVEFPAISEARLPAVYETAKLALAQCTRIDECQSWADKAEAMASYARQAKDDSLRKMADRIQARAIRRCGELLRQIQAETPKFYESADALVDAFTHYAQDYKKNKPPEIPGVYAFWLSKGRCLYVGESQNLRHRLRSGHSRRKEFPKCSIQWLGCENHKTGELWLIEAFMPIRNGVTKQRENLEDMALRKHGEEPLHVRMNDVWSFLFGETFEQAIANTSKGQGNETKDNG